MASLPVEILVGIYLGILTGIIPALVAWGLGFGFKYFTGVSIPGFGVVVLSVALAGVNGGLLALADPTVTQSANAPTVVSGILVVIGLSLYAHSKGDQLGANFPRRLSLSKLREQRLPRDVVELIGGRDEVRLRIVGDVADMEGYPPLSDDTRAAIRAVEYTFPSDLRVSELEQRFAERLRTEFDLGDVAVAIDEKGRASVSAAPPFSGLSKRVPAGKRAVSVDALIPTGLARGDEITLITTDAQVSGTVVSARTGNVGGGGSGDGGRGGAYNQNQNQNQTQKLTAPVTPALGPDAASSDSDSDGDVPKAVRAPTTAGGDGRLTAAVTRTDAEPLVRADRARIVVEARGTRLEYELISLLKRRGKRFRQLTVAAGGALDGTALGAINIRETYGVAVLAIRKSTGWQLVPSGSVECTSGDEIFAVGTREALDDFTEVVS